jgi:peptidoglycan/xylan/chitin deacetylase (PgdA/CDA1 family)
MSRRRFLFGAAVCAACAATGVGELFTAADAEAAPPVHHTDTRRARHQAQPAALFDVRTSRRIVALTFDDGPDPAYTPEVLDILKHYDAKATFFVVGVNALAHPDLIAAQRSAGHSFGNHTFDHPDLDVLPGREVASELERGRRALLDAGVPTTRLFRPPKGYTDRQVRVEAERDRYTTVFWDTCVERFVNHTSTRRGVRQVLQGIRPGGIVLAHDGGTITGRPGSIDRTRTIAALPVLLETLRDRGYRCVDVPTLLTTARGGSVSA